VRCRITHLRSWHGVAFIAIALIFGEGCSTHRTPRASPLAPVPVIFTATAYCQGTTTAAGVHVRRGIVAADPAVLPLGTRIRIEQSGRYDGIYTVMDTGPRVKGRHVDVFVDDCTAARRFGRRSVRIAIVDAHD
jgi:3D (Asp-Asp-Asp) domain-containing protein